MFQCVGSGSDPIGSMTRTLSYPEESRPKGSWELAASACYGRNEAWDEPRSEPLSTGLTQMNAVCGSHRDAVDRSVVLAVRGQALAQIDQRHPSRIRCGHLSSHSVERRHAVRLARAFPCGCRKGDTLFRSR